MVWLRQRFVEYHPRQVYGSLERGFIHILYQLGGDVCIPCPGRTPIDILLT